MTMSRTHWEWLGSAATGDPSVRLSYLRYNPSRSRLNAIVDRRNQIAHEGDYSRLDRPQTARTNTITQHEAADDIAFLASLIDAIHSVA